MLCISGLMSDQSFQESNYGRHSQPCILFIVYVLLRFLAEMSARRSELVLRVTSARTP